MVQDDAEDQCVRLVHDEAQQGHGKLRGHAQAGLVHGGKDLDHGGKLLGHDGEGQLDGEGGGRGHCGAEPGDEVPENR